MEVVVKEELFKILIFIFYKDFAFHILVSRGGHSFKKRPLTLRLIPFRMAIKNAWTLALSYYWEVVCKSVE